MVVEVESSLDEGVSRRRDMSSVWERFRQFPIVQGYRCCCCWPPTACLEGTVRYCAIHSIRPSVFRVPFAMSPPLCLGLSVFVPSWSGRRLRGKLFLARLVVGQ